MTHTDQYEPAPEVLSAITDAGAQVVLKTNDRTLFLNRLKGALTTVLPREFLAPPELLAGIVPPGGTVSCRYWLIFIPVESAVSWSKAVRY